MNSSKILNLCACAALLLSGSARTASAESPDFAVSADAKPVANAAGCWSGSTQDARLGAGTVSFTLVQDGKKLTSSNLNFEWGQTSSVGMLTGTANAKGINVHGTSSSSNISCKVTSKGSLPTATEIVGSYKFQGQCRSKGDFSQGTFDVHPCEQTLWVFDVNISRLTEFLPPFATGADAALVVGQPDFNTTSAGVSQNKLDGPTGGSFDKSGNLWVADESNDRVLKFVPPFINDMNASVVIGQPDFVSRGQRTTQNGLNTPQGIAFDGSGNIWVAEFFNNRVVEFVPPFSNGMNASLVLGQPDFTSSAASTSQGGLSAPTAVAFDKSGNLWAAEFDNNRVVEYKPPFTNGMNASVVLGQANFTSAVATTTQTSLWEPSGLAADTAGNLFVADFANDRVVEFQPPFSSGMAAAVVLGQANFNSNASAVSQTGFEGPEQMGFDSSGNLFVSDPFASRVLEFSPPFSNGMNASLVLGQPDFTSSTPAAGTSGMDFPAGVALSHQ